jgi:hypothetical protein
MGREWGVSNTEFLAFSPSFCYFGCNCWRRAGGIPVQRNSSKCAHCGHGFYRLSEKTPVVNRSDETTFHLTLFFGPDLRSKSSGGYYPGQLVCNFTYVQDQLGPQTNFLLVMILHATEFREDALQQVEDAADTIAELLKAGKQLEAIYTFDRGRLTLGFPK